MKYLSNVKAKIPRIAFLAALCALVFLRYNYMPAGEPQKGVNVTIEDIRVLFPRASSFEPDMGPEKWSRVLDGENETIGWYVNTSPYADDISGHGGEVPFIIGFDTSGRISGLKLLDHAETPAFMEEVEESGFFMTWNGLEAREAALVEVDTVTGATMTSSAVADSLRKRLSLLCGAVSRAPGKGRRIKWPLSLLVVLLALFSFLEPDGARRWRVLLGILSACVLGFLTGYFLSLELFFKWIVNGVPCSAFPVLFLIAALSVILPVFTNKNFYCYHVCPYGFLQELAGSILKRRPVLPGNVRKVLKRTRRVYLFAIILAVLAGVPFDLSSVEPFSSFLVRSAALPALVLGGVFLLFSVFFPRFWCAFLCPTGQVMELLARKRR